MNQPPANRMKLLAQQLVETALNLIFPPLCINCERVGSFLCPRCIASAVQAPPRKVNGLDGVRAAVNYDGAVSVAIKALKYEGQTRLAEPLGDFLVQVVNTEGWPIDLVTAVPLHAARLCERGYNQAALLGAVVARRRGWAFCPDAVERLRETASQVHLNAEERRKNVDGAFSANANVVQGKTVLVIDDVLTTGSTLSACADALRRAGAVQVFGATVAGAVFSDQQ